LISCVQEFQQKVVPTEVSIEAIWDKKPA
jgi:hypothetical protein